MTALKRPSRDEEYTEWQEFQDATGFDDDKFAGKYPYSELVQLLYPDKCGSIFDLVIYEDKVGLVPGERAYLMRWSYENDELTKNWGKYVRLEKKLKAFHLPFPKRIYHRGEFRFTSDILWSDRIEDVYFAQAVRQHMPWRQVNRTRCHVPFGVIKVGKRKDKSDKALWPVDWKFNGPRGRWKCLKPFW